MTGMRRSLPCWSIRTGKASRASCCCRRIATASSTCSTGPNGKLLLAKPFLKKLNWAEGIGADGRPILKELPKQANGETYVCPGFQGGTNWFSTSFNPGTGLYLLPGARAVQSVLVEAWEWAGGQGLYGRRGAAGSGRERSRSFCARSTFRPARSPGKSRR